MAQLYRHKMWCAAGKAKALFAHKALTPTRHSLRFKDRQRSRENPAPPRPASNLV
jgi:hypothetical protein